MSTIIDIFCHIFPERYFEEMTKAAPNLENMGKRLRGVPSCSISTRASARWTSSATIARSFRLPNPPIEDIADGKVGLSWRGSATTPWRSSVRAIPSGFRLSAAVSMTDVEGSVAEARRAVKDLGAGGIQVFTTVAGRPLDDPTFEPIFATMAELDLPIWLHPARSGAHAGLSGGGEIALRDVVVLRLALRHLGGDGADGVLRDCSTAIRSSRSSPIISAA